MLRSELLGDLVEYSAIVKDPVVGADGREGGKTTDVGVTRARLMCFKNPRIQFPRPLSSLSRRARLEEHRCKRIT